MNVNNFENDGFAVCSHILTEAECDAIASSIAQTKGVGLRTLLVVQPPETVLRDLVAVRLHLDECGLGDGPLRIVPGSHQHGRLSHEAAVMRRDQAGEVACSVTKGGVLMLKPLVLHASSKAAGHSRRRVLHFVFGPSLLPLGLRWSAAI